MKRFGIKSIRQMFSLFLLITLLIVVICSVYTSVVLYKNMAHAKKSAVDSACYSTDKIISEHLNAITDVESLLYNDRAIQDFLNETDPIQSEILKVDAAGIIHNTLNAKGLGMGSILFGKSQNSVVLSCNSTSDEQSFIDEMYRRYLSSEGDLFMYEPDNQLYSEFYICRFTPVIYHSLKEVNSYEVGTMAIFSKVNFYELEENAKKNSVILIHLVNHQTDEVISLVDTTSGEQGGKTAVEQRVGYTSWFIQVELFEIIGVSVLSPFVFLSILLLGLLLLYVILFRKSMRVLVDTPINKLSCYLEEFMISKSGKVVLDSVGVDEFDDILKYINELFDRVTKQARMVVYTQQKMYEKELQANEQTLYMNQLQINPHFLFNTLNTITQMCLAKGLDNVTDITHSIAEIFRYSTEGDHKATLDEEIYIVYKYIKIFNSRYGREFQCELDIEDELYELEIMKMILQPLIENSFKHGDIANVENPLIQIAAYREQRDIVITVTDNGTGIDAATVQSINYDLSVANTKKNQSIGLLNVNKRLKICYGEQSGLTVESEYGKYTKIIIRIKDEKQS